MLAHGDRAAMEEPVAAVASVPGVCEPAAGERVRSPEQPVHPGRMPANSTEEHMKRFVEKFLTDESGASLIEYVLIGGIISIVGVATMTLIGGDVGTIWTNIRAGTGGAAG